jgi:hypothetical protein
MQSSRITVPGCGGLCISIDVLLRMVIKVIYLHDILALEGKDHPPIPTHLNRPITSQVPLERMEPKPRQGHISGRLRHMQSSQNEAKARDLRGMNPDCPSGLKKRLKRLTSKRTNHVSPTVTLNVTLGNH